MKFVGAGLYSQHLKEVLMKSRSLCIFILALLFFASQASAYSSDDIEWESAETQTLHWGDSVTVDGYVITADDFSKDGVAYINVYKDNNLVNSAALGLSDNLVYRDTEGGNDINVFVSALSLTVDEWTGNLDDPTVTVQVYKRGLPDLDISIDVEQTTYDPTLLSTPPYIEANVTIKNAGNAEASNVVLNIDTDDLELADGKLTQTTSSLEKEESTKTLSFSLEIPMLWDEEEFEITAQATAYDINGEKYMFNGTKTITIKPKSEVVLSKSCTKEIYIDEIGYVSVIARNTGSFAVNSLIVSDSLNENLELGDNVQPEKTITLDPDQTVNVLNYSIKPIKPGTYTLPKATANFTVDGKSYSFESEAPTIEVKGPYIVLEKKANLSAFSPGDDVLVTVYVKNEGNKDANVKIDETVPEGTSYVSGPLSFNSVVNGGSTESFSYALKLENEADIELPAANGTFIDLEGYTGKRNSSTLLIPLGMSGSEVAYESQPEDEALSEADAEQQVEESYDPESEEEMQSSSDAVVSEDSQISSDSDENKTITGIDPDLRQQPGFDAWVLVLAFIAILKIEKKGKS